MKPKGLVFITILFWSVLVSSGIFAQSNHGIHFSIQFFEQQMYFPGDPVQLRITLKNNSSEMFRFRLADNRMFNLDFEVVDLRNVSQPASDDFTTQRLANQRIFFREVSLNPGEEFSFIETLNHFRNLPEGVFVVRGFFYPDLVGPQTMDRFVSNRLTLSVRPGFRQHEQAVLAVQESVGQILQRSPIPPDEVIAQLLQARMQSNRSRFFLHLDVRSLFRMDPRRDAQFRRLSEQDQMVALREFEELLWAPSIQDSISRVPIRFDIIRTTYDATNATVEAIQRYQMNSFVEIKRFTYRLTRMDGVWYVVSYTVTNMGTE